MPCVSYVPPQLPLLCRVVALGRFYVAPGAHTPRPARFDPQGYDISFLITNTHTENLWKHKLIDFVIQFMQDINKEISDMKIAVSARGRVVAESFMRSLTD